MPTPDGDQSFELSYIHYLDATTGVPVENNWLMTTLAELESRGLRGVDENELNLVELGSVLHSAFSEVVGLEVVPPLSKEQMATVSEKVATYAAMQEVALPKTVRKTTATSTDHIPTDKSKGGE